MSSESIDGIIKRINENQFAVRCAAQSYRAGRMEIMVDSSLARKYRLAEGASVTGRLEKAKGRQMLTEIETLGAVPN